MDERGATPQYGLVADVLVSGTVAVVATWWWHQFPWGGLLFGCLAGGVLMWRRHRPLPVLAAVMVLGAVAAVVQVHGTRLHQGMSLVTLGFALYAVLVYVPDVRVAAGAGVATLLFSTALIMMRPPPRLGWRRFELLDALEAFGQVVAFSAVIWAAALIVRLIRQQRTIAQERRAGAERDRMYLAQIAVAEERTRIARELHDIVAHSLSVIVLHANGASYVLDQDLGEAREALQTISVTGRDALAEIQQLVEHLRSDAGEAGGPSQAVPEQIATVVERARGAGLAVDLVVDGVAPAMPGGVALAVTRIVQESLTNTLKHAGRHPVATVHVWYRPDAIEVEVEDDGRGGAAPRPGGFGLVGMRERAQLYGGKFVAGPGADGGWRVRASIPLGGAVERAVEA
jgi:signal transduction histidine kinase